LEAQKEINDMHNLKIELVKEINRRIKLQDQVKELTKVIQQQVSSFGFTLWIFCRFILSLSIILQKEETVRLKGSLEVSMKIRQDLERSLTFSAGRSFDPNASKNELKHLLNVCSWFRFLRLDFSDSLFRFFVPSQDALDKIDRQSQLIKRVQQQCKCGILVNPETTVSLNDPKRIFLSSSSSYAPSSSSSSAPSSSSSLAPEDDYDYSSIMKQLKADTQLYSARQRHLPSSSSSSPSALSQSFAASSSSSHAQRPFSDHLSSSFNIPSSSFSSASSSSNSSSSSSANLYDPQLFARFQVDSEADEHQLPEPTGGEEEDLEQNIQETDSKHNTDSTSLAFKDPEIVQSTSSLPSLSPSKSSSVNEPTSLSDEDNDFMKYLDSFNAKTQQIVSKMFRATSVPSVVNTNLLPSSENSSSELPQSSSSESPLTLS
jgi:hypothetical protein